MHGEYTMFVQRGNGGFGNDIINLLLIQLAKLVQRAQTLFNQTVDLGYGGVTTLSADAFMVYLLDIRWQ
ncbi:hypothetical protein HMPREF3156_00062 [Neisseria sp. HMSC06F02]|nr:hypothetical protein HMPREF3156_00062 [Neisseria sp. HMSC06F02]